MGKKKQPRVIGRRRSAGPSPDELAYLRGHGFVEVAPGQWVTGPECYIGDEQVSIDEFLRLLGADLAAGPTRPL